MDVWKTISASSFLVSIILLVISSIWEIESQAFNFLWLLYGLLLFSLWNYFPNTFEAKYLEKKPTKNWLLILPVILVLVCILISNDPAFPKKEIALIISIFLFFWLTCMTFFGRTVFSQIFYGIIKDPFQLIFRRRIGASIAKSANKNGRKKPTRKR